MSEPSPFNAEATKKVVALGEQEVKGHGFLFIDLQNQPVRLKLHLLLQGVDDDDNPRRIRRFPEGN